MSDVRDKPRIESLSLRRVTRYMMALAREWETHGMPELPEPAREEPRVSRQGYLAPSIPDPWDVDHPRGEDQPSAPEFSIPRKLPEEEPLAAPTGVSLDPEGETTDPWTREPVTVAHSRAGLEGGAQQPPAPDAPRADEAHPAEEGLAPWEAEDLSDEELAATWEMPDLLPDADEEEPAPAFRVEPFASSKEREDFDRAMMYLSQDDDFLVTGVGKRVPPDEPAKAPESEENPPEEVAAVKPVKRKRAPARNEPELINLEETRAAKEKKPSPMRKVLPIALIVLLVAAIGLAVWYFFFYNNEGGTGGVINASVVYVGDEAMGCVQDGLALQLAAEMLREQVEMDTMLPAVLSHEIRVEPMRIDARYLAPHSEMERAVFDVCRVMVEAHGVYVGGELVGAAYSEEDVAAAMEEGLAPYRQLADQGRSIRDLGYVESVEIRPVTVPAEDLLSREALFALLVSGGDAAAGEYLVAEGDSLAAVASANGLTLGQIRSANPQLIGTDQLRAGERLSLTPPSGLLTVRFTEQVTEETRLPYGTIAEASDALVVTQTEEKTPGVDGLREITADRTYVAGVSVGETILQETVITEAVDRVVLRGTKAVAAASGSTIYLWPVEGAVTAAFSDSEGEEHEGIDITAAAGTPVYAARDGKVTFSGTNGDFGKTVKIDHGETIETRYAHCSVLLVTAGTTVKKGQVIALTGATGGAEELNLHFEVRVGGEAKNPQHYLPSR